MSREQGFSPLFRAVSRLVAAALLPLAMAACTDERGADESSSTSASAPVDTASTTDASPAATAIAVCDLLRTFVNDSADIANAAAADVTASDDPLARRSAVLTGFDALLVRAQTHHDDVEALDPADLSQGDAMVADLLEGAQQAISELTEERAAFELLPGLERADTAGRVGQFFNSLEKAMSVVEPAITQWAELELVDAFAAEPTCRFVVQT